MIGLSIFSKRENSVTVGQKTLLKIISISTIKQILRISMILILTVTLGLMKVRNVD